jgi:methionyl aminopeptidase
VNIDRGHHADLNETFFIGNVDEESRRLVRAAFESLSEASKLIRPGTMYRQLGQEITKVANRERFSVVKSYCGHGM